MTDRTPEPFTAAEARLATRLGRWSDQGVVRIDAAAIARRSAVVARRRSVPLAHRLGWAGSRRAVMGVAAVPILALGLALAAATLPSPAPPVTDRAVVVRPTGGGMEVVLVRPDGAERLLRHVTAAGLGFAPDSTFRSDARLGRHGWLELHVIPATLDPTGPAPYGHDILIDLADPEREPIVLAANGFMSGVWGPDGRYAHYDLVRASRTRTAKGGPARGGPLSGGDVTVIDPEAGAGSAVSVPSVQTFGGGPVIVWAADGTGFLTHEDAGWGVRSIETGRIVPGARQALSRWMDPMRPGVDRPEGLVGLDPWGAGELLGGEPMGTQLAADGTGLWQLLDTSDATRSQAVLARLTGPGTVVAVHTFDLPEGPSAGYGWSAQGFTLSADDTLVALDIPTFLRPALVLAPLASGVEHVATGPVVDGYLAGMAAGAEADAWPGP